MRKLLFIIPILVLSACNTLKGETAQQKLYGAIADYKQVQMIAIEYKKDCDLKGELDLCKAKVKQIKEVNHKANSLIQAVDTKEDGIDYIKTITNSLTIITKELSSIIGEKA